MMMDSLDSIGAVIQMLYRPVTARFRDEEALPPMQFGTVVCACDKHPPKESI